MQIHSHPEVLQRGCACLPLPCGWLLCIAHPALIRLPLRPIAGTHICLQTTTSAGYILPLRLVHLASDEAMEAAGSQMLLVRLLVQQGTICAPPTALYTLRAISAATQLGSQLYSWMTIAGMLSPACNCHKKLAAEAA